jgi:phospholipase/carboxylesterase
MREGIYGGLKVRLTGGTDREGGGSGPLLVLMHGFGAPGTDLVPLWRELDVPRELRFAFPEAPLALDIPGLPDLGPEGPRAWWMIDVEKLEAALASGQTRDLTREVPEGLSAARQSALAMLDELGADLGVDGDHTLLGGFSQGAMLALDVALSTERPLAGLVLLSGTLLAEDLWLPRMATRAGLPVLQSHGRMDPLLPFSIAERLRDELVRAGLEVRFLPFNGAHEIAGGVLDELAAFVRRALPD